ncbi:MAG: family 10 glycosylhydrolase [Armatimonadota bacterium]
MKAPHMYLSAVLLCLVIGGCFAATEINLLQNGGFEDGSENWSIEVWEGTGEGIICRDEVKGGEKALRLSGSGKEIFIVTRQRVPILDTSAPVTLKGFWKAELNEGTSGARIIMRWINRAGEKITDEPVLQKPESFDWTAFEETWTPPDEAAGAILYLEIRGIDGTVWYDDVSLTQDVDVLDMQAVTPGGDPDALNIAVFDATAAGGRNYGAAGIYEVLDEAGIAVEYINDLRLDTLLRYDALVLPNVHRIGRASNEGLRSRFPELAWMLDPGAAISAYTRAGGGLILTHQSNGGVFFQVTPAPGVAEVIDKTYDIKATRFEDHPLTAGLEPFASSFSDSRIFETGPKGEAVMYNNSGHVLAAAGTFGAGKVAAIGLCPGIDENEAPVTPTGGEAQLMVNAAQWAGDAQWRDHTLVFTPTTVDLRDPADRVEQTVVAVPLSADAPARVPIEIVLVNEDIQQVFPEGDEAFSMEATRDPQTFSIDSAELEDGTYYVGVRLPADKEEAGAEFTDTEVVASVKNTAGFARFADSLPKAEFNWKSMNVHGGVNSLDTEEKIAEMARLAAEMNFDAVLYAAKPPNAYLYYNTEIGEKAPGFEDIDPLELAVKHCHANGLQLLVQFCTFREGSASQPSKFIREHPEYADWNPGDGPDISKHSGGVFGCPDRPEVRAYELSLIREMAENYDIDGISFDYIRYKNDKWCVCPYSQKKFAEYHENHPDLNEAQARRQFAEEAIVSFTWEVRELLDEFDREMILHGYCHPTWANKFPLNYLSFRASAHWTQPGRGGPWTLERVFEASKRNVELADDHVEFMTAAPMCDVGYYGHHKPPERLRRELRLISHAGAPDIMVYLYSTLVRAPELRQVLTEEFAE